MSSKGVESWTEARLRYASVMKLLRDNGFDVELKLWTTACMCARCSGRSQLNRGRTGR